MAPEQARGDVANIGPSADIYALGIIFYQMLTGDLPFVSDTPWGILHKQLNEDPLPIAERNLKVPESLFRVVMTCLEKEIDKRPESVHKIKELLENAKNETGEGAQATIFYEDAESLPTIDDVQPDSDKKRLGIKMAVGLTIAAAAIGLMVVTGTGDKDDSPIVAQKQITAQKQEEPPAKIEENVNALKVPKQADTGEKPDLTKYRAGNGRRGYFGESGPGRIGKKLFGFASGDWVNSSPAIKGGRIYFGCDDNTLFGVDKKTGKVAMVFETGEAITGSPVVDKNKLYITSHDYYAYAIDITTAKLSGNSKPEDG
jgi:hypothetical protein